jgi:hypothetical protein
MVIKGSSAGASHSTRDNLAEETPLSNATSSENKSLSPTVRRVLVSKWDWRQARNSEKTCLTVEKEPF